MYESQDFDRLLRVFLCHSSTDKQVVRDLFWTLRSEGLEPWLDEESLLPGEEWHHEIAQAIRASDVVLVCLSSQSINKAGYVQKEILYALDVADEQPPGTIYIVPFKLDECEIPERLRRWQWVSIRDPRWHERLMKTFHRRAAHLGLRLRVVSAPELEDLPYTLLAQVITRVENILQDSLSLRHIELRVKVDPDIRIDIPQDIAALALVNLVSNAKDAIDKEGTISIEAEDAGSMINCHVSDNGPGVPAMIKESIFELGISTKASSAGWGLYLTRRVLQEHRGDLLLSTWQAGETRFTVRFPKPGGV